MHNYDSVYVCDDHLPHRLVVNYLYQAISSNLKDDFCVHNNVKSKLSMCEMDGQILIFIIKFQDKFSPLILCFGILQKS